MIAICVVYLVDENSEYLFYKHLEQIERCSQGQDVRIYAGVNRLATKYLEHLRTLPFVSLAQLQPTERRASHEHAHFLDQLVDFALADGAEHIVTLDVDSFPISPDWLSHSQAELDAGHAFVAVLRRENGDTAAPHPSFMFFSRDFWTTYRPTFAIPADSPEVQAFKSQTRQPRLDTAAGIGLLAHRERLSWAQLLRSNKLDPHPLMAGIYGNRVFHFGGGSRDKVFSIDVRLARQSQPQATLQELWPGIAARNEVIAAEVLREMQADFDGYMRRLAGG